MKRIALGLAAVLLAGVACSPEQGLADMELRVQSGDVQVLRDGETIDVDNRLELKPGDVIITKEDALARFALEGGAGARQGQIQGDSRVLVSSTTSVEAEEGQVLLQVAEPTRVVVDGVTAKASDSSFRVDRGFGSVRAGLYRGSLQLSAPGQSDIRMSPLYQATIVAGDLPNTTKPYRLNEEDPWDRVLLEDVLTLEQELAVLASGLTNQLGRQRPDLDYFRALVDGGKIGFMSSYLRRKPSDLLIGFTIARNSDGPLQRSFTEAFDLFDDGARWGVAAKILDVEPRPVLAQLERLILGTGVAARGGGSKARFTVAAATAAETGASVVAPSEQTTSAPDGDGGTAPTQQTGPTDPGDPGKPKESTQKPPQEPKEEPDECTNTAECAVKDVEDQLPGPQPSPSPTQEEKNSLLDGGLGGR